MLYSKSGLTSDLYNCKITSLSLILNDLLIFFITLLAVLTALRHCLLHFMSYCILTPSLLSSVPPLNIYHLFRNLLLFSPMCTNLHLSTLNNIIYFKAVVTNRILKMQIYLHFLYYFAFCYSFKFQFVFCNSCQLIVLRVKFWYTFLA